MLKRMIMVITIKMIRAILAFLVFMLYLQNGTSITIQHHGKMSVAAKRAHAIASTVPFIIA